jgi:hypothetical protein
VVRIEYMEGVVKLEVVVVAVRFRRLSLENVANWHV